METKAANRQEKNDVVKVRNNYYYVHPRCDIRESADHYTLVAEMPGANKDRISVSIGGKKLIIDAQINIEESGTLILAEIPKRNYHRTFSLGESIDAAKIDAQWQDGILILKIAKKEAAKPRDIEIKFN